MTPKKPAKPTEASDKGKRVSLRREKVKSLRVETDVRTGILVVGGTGPYCMPAQPCLYPSQCKQSKQDGI